LGLPRHYTGHLHNNLSLPDIVADCVTGALAERLWNPERVAGMYKKVYGQVIERSAQKATSTFPLR
jgi:hypothetical protein